VPRFLEVSDKAAAKAAINADYYINVKDYAGIDLTGAVASDTAFQAILNAAAADAAAAEGVVEVYIPAGVLLLASTAVVGSGVTVRGAGRDVTTIRGSGARVLRLMGESDITVSDLTVECVDNVSSIALIAEYEGLARRLTITNCRFTGATNGASGVRFGPGSGTTGVAVENLTFSDNTIEDCAAGVVVYAPTVTSGLISKNLVISRNRCRNVGSLNIQVFGPGPQTVNPLDSSTIFGVEISGNDLRDFAQTGPGGPIPIEPTGITGLVVANNTIDGTATRGISMANNVNTTVVGNFVRGQSTYAFELNGGRQMSIVGNVAENCRAFAHETGYDNPTGRIRLSDAIISNNVYFGSGLSVAASSEPIRIATGRRVRISGNIINNWQYLRTAIRIGDGVSPTAEDCVVEGNTFVVSDANTPLNTINVRSAIRTNIVRNTLRVNRNLVSGDNSVPAIQVVMDAATSDTLVADNHIVFSGTVAAAADASGVGNNPGVAASACAKLTVRRNHVVNGPRGVNLATNSTDLVVDDNDTTTCVGADIIPSTVNRTQSLVHRTIQTITTAASIPTNTGDRIVLIDTGGVPTLGTAVGADCVIKVKNRTDAGVAIATTSSQTIEGLATYTLPAGQSITVVPNSTSNWSIV
jgi:hypothetical protein